MDVESKNDDQIVRYSESELVQLVKEVISTSSTDDNVGTSRSRDLAYDYYYGDRPYAVDGNTSEYVSREVFDSVEGLKAKLLRTFRSTRNVVRFKPSDENDVENADLRTRYINKLIIDEGKGYKFLHDLFHDGLLTKLATATYDYVETKEIEEERFEGVPTEQLSVLAQREDVLRIQIEDEQEQVVTVPTQMGPAQRKVRMASGTVTVQRMKKEIVLDVLPPENVFIPEHVVDPMQVPELVLRYYKPKYQLVKEGFDPAIVDKLRSTPTEEARQVGRRRQSYELGGAASVFSSGRNEREIVQLDVAYLMLDMETPKGQPPSKTRLWRLMVAGEKVLDAEPMGKINARFWSPIMVAHRAIGMSIADVTIDLQTTISNTVRGIEDNVHRVNAGVRIANMDLIRNPRDLIDNPIGGVIDSSDPSRALSVVPQPSLSPSTGQLLEVLSLQKEMRTGDTRLGKGLQTQDVVTHQNAKDMINQLINVGNERPLQMARAFAELCLVPMMQDVYQIAYENDVVVDIEVKGKLQPFSPKSIPFCDDMEIDVALTPEYGEQRAMQLAQAAAQLQQNPALGPLFTMKEQYALHSEIFHLLGTANWLADPDDPEVQQRLQGMQQENLQQKQQKDAIIQKEMELREREVRVKEQSAGITGKLRKEDLDLKAAVAADKQSLDEREFAWQQRTDVAELQIEKEQKRAAAIGDKKVRTN